MKSLDYAKTLLFVFFLTVLLLPFVPILANNAVVTLGFLVIVLGIWATYNKKQEDVVILAIILLSLIVAKVAFPDTPELTLLLSLSGILSFIFLSFTLLMGPWARLIKQFALILKHRRHVGVTTFLLAVVHAYLVISLSVYGLLYEALTFPFIFFGFISLYIMTLLALTSWNAAQKSSNLKRWNLLHFSTFLIYLLLVIYLLNSAVIEPTNLQKNILLLFGIYWFLTIPAVALVLKKTFGGLQKINGWKQLHILIYAGYISVIFHISQGVLAGRPAWVQVLFWLLVIKVIASHLIGWFIKLNAKSTSTSNNPSQ